MVDKRKLEEQLEELIIKEKKPFAKALDDFNTSSEDFIEGDDNDVP